jgi:CRISPR type III-B/RAMP module-associated protein Cmr3
MSDERNQTETWTLLFEPLGVLVFRDDRPFNAGQHSLAVSRFPLPSVFRGAIRTALFEAAGADFHADGFGLADEYAILGNAADRERFNLRGPLVARLTGSGYEYVLPWPRDLVVIEDDEGKERQSKREEPPTLMTEVMQARPALDPAPTCMRMSAASNGERKLEPLTTALPWTMATRLPKPKGRPWLTVAGAKKYNEHSQQPGARLELVEEEDWLEQDSFLDEEKRVGIARATESGEERLVAADSMLYTLLAWRMDPAFRFACEIDVEDPKSAFADLVRELDRRLVRLGGKSGHARVTVIEGAIRPEWAQPVADAAPVSSKLWLWTPALYDAGTAGMDAVLGETIRLGGFDMANHCPRPLVSAFDRGSVLWFSALDHQKLAHCQEKRANENGLHPASYGYGHWIPRSTP